MKNTLILTDPFVRKTFDVYNVLARRWPELRYMLVYPDGDTNKLRALYPKIIYTVPSMAAVAEYAAARPEEVFIYLPFEENTTLAFYQDVAIKSLPNVKALLPSEGDFTTARNKLMLARFCRTRRMPSPDFYEQSEVASANFSFVPLIAKPAIGSGALGHIHVDQPEDLGKLQSLTEPYVIQRKLANPREVRGGFFLMEKGRLLAYYGHRRLRTYPPEGGVTVYSAYEEDEDIRTLGTRVLEELNWTGLAMLEFLFDERDREYKLIEINPRLWGSILLSEFSGARLVEKYIQRCLGEQLTDSSIDLQAKIRWLIPYDILHGLRGGWRKKNFWRLDRSHTTYINMSFASPWRSFCWHLFSILDPEKLHKLYRKMLGG